MDGLRYGTINSQDPDVAQVAAALADACHAGGLADAYYRKADDALKRLAGRTTRPSEAADHLRVALKQVTSQDDEILVGHMRDALALLEGQA